METNKKTVKLIMVTDANVKGNNKYYHMTELDNGNFLAEWGRVDKTHSEKEYPMYEWDKKYNEKTRKGYKDMTRLFVESKSAAPNCAALDIKDPKVKMLIDELMSFANNTIRQNYKVSKESVTQAMVDEAQQIVDELATIMNNKASISVREFNKLLLDLYMVIPRQMGNVKDYLVDETEVDKDKRMRDLIDEEQSLLDTMAGQVQLINQQHGSDEKDVKSTDILGQMGIEIFPAMPKELDHIKKLMAERSDVLKNAFRVIHSASAKRFKDNINKAVDKSTMQLFHGSRNQNWFNILQTSLLIRPSGAIHTGSMFGDGIYGANRAQKAIGYTSSRGAYWTGGGSDKGFLGIFEFHTGRQKHVHTWQSNNSGLNKRDLAAEGFDSVYAHTGQSLRNDEFIVYDAAQVTINFLMEIR